MKLSAFDQGQLPQIAVVNQAKTPLGTDFAKLVAALQKYVDQLFGPVWGVACKLTIAKAITAKSWGFVFLDDADSPGALGYHDLTDAGLPLSKIFVRTTIAAGEQVSVTASHELGEMLVDPAANLWANDPKGTLYAWEVADAVEETSFKVDGVAMSNFVYPSWFEGFRKAKSTKFDYLGLCTKPYQLLSGGYAIVEKGGRVSNIFGSHAKKVRFADEDRRGHRSEMRKLAGGVQ